MERLKQELKTIVEEDIIEGLLEDEVKGTFISNLVITDRKNTDCIRLTLECQAVNNNIFATNESIPMIEELRHKRELLTLRA